MAKQILLMLLLSLAAIMFRDKLVLGLDALVYAHNQIASVLHVIFAEDQAGRLIQDMIALLSIPAAFGGLAAAAFWAAKREPLPHVMMVVWVVWLILLVSMALAPSSKAKVTRPVTVLSTPVQVQAN